MSGIIQRVGATLAMALVGLGLASCGGANQQTDPGTAPAITVGDVLSERCGIGLVIDYDGSPGASTRSGALDDFGKMLRSHLAKAPESPDPTTMNDSLKDPVRLAAGIRGVEALKENLPKVESTTKPGDLLEITAETKDGQRFAYSFVDVQADGTYRVDTFNASGFQSDGPQCK